MRAGVHRYLEALPKAPFRIASSYDMPDEASPLVAYDAEVSQFAATATAFAVDTIIDRSPSSFPQSAYVIGYKREWIFEGPFDTQPIQVEVLPAPAGEGSVQQTDVAQKAAAMLVELINQQVNADASAPR
jgi:hypothetical protein